MPKTFQLAKIVDALSRDEPWPNPRQLQSQALQQFLMIITALFEVVFEFFTYSFQRPLERTVEPCQLIGRCLKMPRVFLLHAFRRFGGGIADDIAVGLQFLPAGCLGRHCPYFSLAQDTVAKAALGQQDDIDAAAEAFCEEAGELADAHAGGLDIDREIDI